MRRGVIAVLIAALATLVACGNDETPNANATSPTPTPTATSFEETEWTITTPAGWTRADTTASVDAKRAVRYTDGAGNYFIVAIDPSGSDFAADEVWRYEVNGLAFGVIEKTKCEGGAEEQCSTTDARYDVYLLGGSHAAPTVGGHEWYFIFGNTKSTTFDPALFEQIVASIRVRL